MNTRIQTFLRMAKEIRCRLDEAKGKLNWWKDLESLTIDFQIAWESIRDDVSGIAKVDHPAFVVWTRMRGFTAPVVLQKFDEYRQRDTGPGASTYFCSFDPWTGDTKSSIVFFTAEKGREYPNPEDRWETASRQINMWIRAVSELASTIPSKSVQEESPPLDKEFTEEARTSGEWAIVFDKSKSTINNMRSDGRIRVKRVSEHLFKVHRDDLPINMRALASRHEKVEKEKSQKPPIN